MSGFQIKTFPAISTDMIARMRASTEKVTDYNIGSVVRSLLEAPALEVDELYQAMYYGLLEAIPTAIYTGFGFDRLPAFAASGWVTASRLAPTENPTPIPAGGVLTAYDGLAYVVAQDSTIPAGETEADIRVVAVVPGAAGNQAPGAINQVVGSITYVSQEISAGADAETESQRAGRFAAFIRTLARGTVASLEYVARLAVVYSGSGVAIERVERAALQEGPGHVAMFVHNGSGATSAGLVDMVQTLVDGYRDTDAGVWIGGWRPTGMRVDVVAMSDLTVDVEIEARAAAAYRTESVKMAIARQMAEYFRGLRPGATVRQIEIRNAALAVPGIESATVLTPATNIPGRIDAALGLGTLDVTWTS